MAKKKTAKKVAKKAAAKPAAKKATKTKAPAKPAAKKVQKKSAPKATKKVVKKTTATKTTSAKKVVKKKSAAKVKVAAKKAPTKKAAAKPEKKTEKKVVTKAPAKKETKVAAPKPKKAAAPVKEKKVAKVSAKKSTPPIQAKKKSRSLEDDFEPSDDSLDDGDDDDMDFDDNGKTMVSDDVYIDEDELIAPSLKDEESIRDNLAEEMVALSEDFNLKDIFEAVRMLDFFVVDSDECIERNCDNPATTLGYCRFHYIRNWKEIKKKQSILMEGKLQNYIEELVSKYPVKYIEAIITDLAEDKSFVGILKELNIESDDDDAYDEDGDDDQDIVFETKQTVKTSFIDD